MEIVIKVTWGRLAAANYAAMLISRLFLATKRRTMRSLNENQFEQRSKSSYNVQSSLNSLLGRFDASESFFPILFFLSHLC